MKTLAERIFKWYGLQDPMLPWGKIHDPYLVWISEVMLQQTQVETVIPYYQRWILEFPNVFIFAKADEKKVLSMWEGLGYYNRAINALKTARIISSYYGGIFPGDVEALKKLPGIGPYIAGAIVSIAFNEDVAILDSNIKRVYSRIFNIDHSIESKIGREILFEVAWSNLPNGHAGDFNQALMLFGETICLPKKPVCPNCPLKSMCLSCKAGVQDLRPVKIPKKKVPHYYVTAAIIRKSGRVLISKRPPGGLLPGMWEFPGGKQERGETLEECLFREVNEELSASIKITERLGVFNHAYTHFHVTLYAYCCVIIGNYQGQKSSDQVIRWVYPKNLIKYPMGKIDRAISKMLV